MRTLLEERVYFTKDELPDWPTREKTIARDNTWLIEKPNSLTLQKSMLLTGLNKTSGNRWWRWETYDLSSVFLTSTGKLHGLQRLRIKNEKAIIGGIPVLAFKNRDFRSKSKEKFGVESAFDVFPAMKCFDARYYDNSQSPYAVKNQKARDALRLEDPRPFLKIIFKDKYNKNILKNIERYHLASVLNLSKIDIPGDWIAETMQNRHLAIIQMSDQSKPVFHGLSRELQRRFGMTNRVYELQDSMRMLGLDAHDHSSRKYQIARASKTVQELHHNLIEYQNAHRHELEQAMLAEPVEYSSPKMVKLLESSVGDMQLELAQRRGDLVDWGKEMSHCIGSYAQNVGGSAYFGAVRRNNELLGNFHIENGGLQQMFGKYNKTFEGRDEVVKYLKENNIKVVNAWL